MVERSACDPKIASSNLISTHWHSHGQLLVTPVISVSHGTMVCIYMYTQSTSGNIIISRDFHVCLTELL